MKHIRLCLHTVWCCYVRLGILGDTHRCNQNQQLRYNCVGNHHDLLWYIFLGDNPSHPTCLHNHHDGHKPFPVEYICHLYTCVVLINMVAAIFYIMYDCFHLIHHHSHLHCYIFAKEECTFCLGTEIFDFDHIGSLGTLILLHHFHHHSHHHHRIGNHGEDKLYYCTEIVSLGRTFHLEILLDN